VIVVLKLSEYFESLSSIGLDYSGALTRLGPRTSSQFAVGYPVIGINTNEGSSESHLTSKDNFLIPLCPSVTFAEGETLPAVTATVYAGLVKAAKLQPNDTILIHPGSGGVGLTAITYARHLGYWIIATAGNERLEESFHPKFTGGWNLRSSTLHYPLEHFIMFSSVSVSLGSQGQSNHCAANTFLDSLAFSRHYLGLPFATMNWGLWGQVGVAANKDVIGIKPMTTYLYTLSKPELGIKSIKRTLTLSISLGF